MLVAGLVAEPTDLLFCQIDPSRLGPGSIEVFSYVSDIDALPSANLHMPVPEGLECLHVINGRLVRLAIGLCNRPVPHPVEKHE